MKLVSEQLAATPRYAAMCGLYPETDWHERLSKLLRIPHFCPPVTERSPEIRRGQEQANYLVFAITPRQPSHHTLHEIAIALASPVGQSKNRLIVLILLEEDDGVIFNAERPMPVKNTAEQFQRWPAVEVLTSLHAAAQFLNYEFQTVRSRDHASFASKEADERATFIRRMR